MATETWLVEAGRWALTPNRYRAAIKDPHVVGLEAVVLHYTASRDFAKTVRWLCTDQAAINAMLEAEARKTGKPLRKGSAVSAHFVLDRTGELRQLAPLEDRTWHAGGNSSRLFDKSNVNGRTIGIELMNVGPLKALTDDKGTPSFVAAVDNKPWTDAGVQAVDGGYWEPFPLPQMDTLVSILDQIYEKHPSLREKSRLVDHQVVDPIRKKDCGPAFPWTVIRGRLGL